MIQIPKIFKTCFACGFVALMLLALSACGQKGDLYLPDRAAQYSSPPAR
ncbi:MAG: LPS translocon maturation chaperone LptM [Gammaproteobacteria bacterium]|jgi:predicted small lipoprotein YifL